MKDALIAAPGARRTTIAAIAFAWGLAEAVAFFIVPDVYLTRVALHDLRRALVACLWATAGALAGGAVLWIAANHGNAPALLHALRRLPGITDQVISASGQGLLHEGPVAMFGGALAGRPYKLYAVHAGAQNVALGAFLAISLLARFARFAATTTTAWLIGRALGAKSEAFRVRLHALFWIVFYTIYFAVMH